MVNTTSTVAEVSEDDRGVVSQAAMDTVPRLATIITTAGSDDNTCDQTTTANLPDGIGASIYGGLNTNSTQSLVAAQPKDTAISAAVETVVEENNKKIISHAPTPTADVFIEHDNSTNPPTTTDGGTTNDDNTKQEKGISLQELIYAASSYHAVVKPVSVTMILTALAVMYINTDATKEAGEQALAQTYQRYTISDDQSAATSLGLGLVNALVSKSDCNLCTAILCSVYIVHLFLTNHFLFLILKDYCVCDRCHDICIGIIIQVQMYEDISWLYGSGKLPTIRISWRANVQCCYSKVQP